MRERSLIMQHDQVTEGDWELLCYLLVKRLGGVVEFTDIDMLNAASKNKQGRLKFKETPGTNGMIVIAEGD